ncbi:hypothetical protein KIM372_17640 [Bombiscardovia nodaiensis]|uniref:Uncharacterized protein n=1 Tax=Bombiscardovia nodaiensis TaxID=2932181 RepID=A0ABM8BAL3_9BIFI|nr:hypothetical protein KIM372_17640 [Bombiscardovia nodaiensis]
MLSFACKESSFDAQNEAMSKAVGTAANTSSIKKVLAQSGKSRTGKDTIQDKRAL